MFQWNSIYNLKKLALLSISAVFLFSPHACFSMDYDDNKDYKNHQKAFNSFFRVEPKYEETVKILNKFKDEYVISPIISDIRLDGLSPRSRILLFRSISQEIFKRYAAEKKRNILYGKYSYFHLYDNVTSSNEVINFSFGSTNFTVRYNPTQMQPGNLVIKGLPKCKDFYQSFNNINNKNYSKKISNLIFEEYKKQTPHEGQAINNVTIFFDFEIARRLIGDIPQNKHDKVPVASAIIAYLELSKEYDEFHIGDLFKVPELIWKDIFFPDTEEEEPFISESISGGIPTYEGFSFFEKEAGIRKSTVKNILAELYHRKEKKDEKTLIDNNVEIAMDKYYDFFGGKEED